MLGLHGASSVGGAVTSRSGAAVYHCVMHLLDGEDAIQAAEASVLFSTLLTKWGALSDPKAGIVALPSHASIETNVNGPTANAEVTLSLRFNQLNQMDALDKQLREVIPSSYRKKIGKNTTR